MPVEMPPAVTTRNVLSCGRDRIQAALLFHLRIYASKSTFVSKSNLTSLRCLQITWQPTLISNFGIRIEMRFGMFRSPLSLTVAPKLDSDLNSPDSRKPTSNEVSLTWQAFTCVFCCWLSNNSPIISRYCNGLSNRTPISVSLRQRICALTLSPIVGEVSLTFLVSSEGP